LVDAANDWLLWGEGMSLDYKSNVAAKKQHRAEAKPDFERAHLVAEKG